MSVTTQITDNDGKIVARTGTSGFTVTGTRTGEHVSVQMEFSIVSQEECVAMMGMLLVQLEQLHDENLIAQCFAHYARETGKEVTRTPGKRDTVLIRGYRKKRGK